MMLKLWEQAGGRTHYFRIAGYCLVVVGLLAWQAHRVSSQALAQAPDEKLEEVSEPSPSADRSSAEAPESEKVPTTLWSMYVESGLIGYVITLLSVIGLGFIVEHFLTIRKATLMPDHVVEELNNLIHQGQLDAAMAFCQEPQNASLFSNVVLAGIERYRGSEFGFAEYKAAVEEAGEEQTNRLYRKTEVLGVIGAIAPMLGLLGTVQGMILGFNTIAATGGTAKPEDLASSISLALVTTFEGLVVAIPVMVAFSFFRNRIDSLVAEAGKSVEQVLAPLGRRKG
jgi:biopolymer transport protein ExbB